MTKEMDKFVMPRNNGTRVGGQKQYPRIRISMVAYAHVCEMSEETRRSLSEVASRAIEYMRLHPEVTEFSTLAKRTGLARNTVKKHYGMVAAMLGRK